MQIIHFKNRYSFTRTPINLVKLAPGLLFGFLLSSCAVGPNYVKPSVSVPAQYKEAPKGWKFAQPCDDVDRGSWWKVFNDSQLNALEQRVNISNQSIAIAEAQYRQSVAMVAEARAGYFPVIAADISQERQKPAAAAFNASSGTGTSTQTGSTAQSLPPFSTYIAGFTATWEPDVWGSVRRMVEASKDTSQATAAQLASIRLSTQSLLAQDYFQLRTLDNDQKILNDIVSEDQKLLKLTQASYQTGTASLADTTQAVSVLKAAQATAIDNGIARAQFEHAIAVLIGVPPANFSIAPKVMAMHPPLIPTQVPSVLLERRPDIAEAERQVAAANAQVGVAIAAFFPVITLTGTGGYQSNSFKEWFIPATSFWALTEAATQTVFAGGFYVAQLAAARATYEQTVANYREIVLAAFQNVEDNLAAERILTHEISVQKQAVAAARSSLKFQTDNYAAGTVNYTVVLTTLTTAFSVEKTYSDLAGRQMTAAVGLITALGGGWNTADLPYKRTNS